MSTEREIIATELRGYAGNPGYSHSDYADIMCQAADLLDKPIDMILHCPSCGAQHIDTPETLPMSHRVCGLDNMRPLQWLNPPHRSHLCHGCWYIWRPADVATNGVQAVTTRSEKDSPAKPAAHGVPDGYAQGVEAVALMIEKKRDDYHFENGSQESDTGAWNYPGDGQDWMNTMDELAEEIRAMLATAPSAPEQLDPVAETLMRAGESRPDAIRMAADSRAELAKQEGLTVKAGWLESIDKCIDKLESHWMKGRGCTEDLREVRALLASQPAVPVAAVDADDLELKDINTLRRWATQIDGLHSIFSDERSLLCQQAAVLLHRITYAAPAQPTEQAATVTAGWISVEDRLPEIGVGVMVYSPPTLNDHPGDVNIQFDCLDPDSDGELWLNWWNHYEHFLMCAPPGSTGPKSEKAPYTHWMPIPDAPGAAPAMQPATVDAAAIRDAALEEAALLLLDEAGHTITNEVYLSLLPKLRSLKSTQPAQAVWTKEMIDKVYAEAAELKKHIKQPRIAADGDGWIEWNGTPEIGVIPNIQNVMVNIKCENGGEDTGLRDEFSWRSDIGNVRIIAYRVVAAQIMDAEDQK